jgi:hypothetical protein
MPFGQGHTGYGRYATNRGANRRLESRFEGSCPAKLSGRGKGGFIDSEPTCRKHGEESVALTDRDGSNTGTQAKACTGT